MAGGKEAVSFDEIIQAGKSSSAPLQMKAGTLILL